jgi:hypothetical protein
MPKHAPTIVYLNGHDNKTHEKAEINIIEIIKKMLQSESDILRCLEFYVMYVKLAKFETKGVHSLQITNDEGKLQRFLSESIVYYFAYGFVAFRLVPYDKGERDFFPVVIPMHQIDFEYDEDDITSIFSVPSVWYKNYDTQSQNVPLIFVYKFQKLSGIHQTLGPMQTLVDSYLDMQKIREYNEIVLTEHKYTLQYVEQEQVTRVSNETMAALEQTYYEMDERFSDDCGGQIPLTSGTGTAPSEVTKRTRNIISAQVIDFENDFSSEISGHIRKNVVVLPPGARVSASTARQLSFHSHGESDLFFSKHVSRVFGVPEQWRSLSGSTTGHDSDATEARSKKEKIKKDNNTGTGSKKPSASPKPDTKFTTPICIQSYYSEMETLLSEMSSALCSPSLFQQKYSRGRKRRKIKGKYQRKPNQPDSIPFQELCMPTTIVWNVFCEEKKLSEYHGADIIS